MDKQRRKELAEAYKQIKTLMGVIQIRNTVNGKIFITTTPNLKNQWLTWKLQLEAGRFMNIALQKEWNEMGPETFVYEVLEEKETEDLSAPDLRRQLKRMGRVWMDKLQPYDEKGYNHRPRD